MSKRIVFVVLACSVALALIIPGCSGSSRQDAESHIVNTTYYSYLKDGKYVESISANPQLPASGELFSENTSVFRLVPANASGLQKQLSDALYSDFALYSPSASLAKRVASTISDSLLASASTTPSTPSLKKQDIIPDSCAGLTDSSLRECLDNNGVSAVPQNDHTSMHDPQSLAIEAGSSVTDSIPGKTVQTIISAVSRADRDAFVAKLTDFTNDDPSHASIDIAAFDPFNPAGYVLKSIVISDASSSDINGDTVPDPHSTMITEIAKPVTYRRSQSAALDSCVQKYGITIDDRYIVKMTTYLHLDTLTSQRQSLPVFTPTDAAPIAPGDFFDSIHNTRIMNHALDANIIKHIYGTMPILPASSTEYSFMFQIDPGQISGEYAELLEKISAAGDSECQEMVEQHINPRTAIISGSSATPSTKAMQKGAAPLTVFYQVPTVFTPQLTAKIAGAITGEPAVPSDSQRIRDYCMVDGNGQKVAIVDPANGAITPACEKFTRKVMAKTVQMTKSGACKDNKGNWAYDPSRLQTPRFGRGIQWIFTEWLLHNQVGDYKNIHWYQSVWKSGVQVAVKGGKIVLATYLKIQLGAIKLKNDDGTDKKKSLIYAKKLLPLLADIVMKMDGMRVAGYKLNIPHSIGDFLSRTTDFFPAPAGDDAVFSNPTFDFNLLLDLSSGVTSFFVDRVTDAAAQMLDVTIVGWEDISDRSHYGCFEFSY